MDKSQVNVRMMLDKIKENFKYSESIHGSFYYLNESKINKHIFNVNVLSFKNFYANLVLYVNDNMFELGDDSIEELRSLMDQNDIDSKYYRNSFFGKKLMNKYHSINREDQRGMKMGNMVIQIGREIMESVRNNYHDVTCIDTDMIISESPIELDIELPIENEKYECIRFINAKRYVFKEYGESEIKVRGYTRRDLQKTLGYQQEMMKLLRKQKIKKILE